MIDKFVDSVEAAVADIHDGAPRLVRECSLPLTGAQLVFDSHNIPSTHDLC
ncbi:MAG: hypothetical protein LBQ32_08555 [Burkholderiaceae bacterium]|nr:hypothetical protein [Burkholderiaceae bacterium]